MGAVYSNERAFRLSEADPNKSRRAEPEAAVPPARNHCSPKPLKVAYTGPMSHGSEKDDLQATEDLIPLNGENSARKGPPVRFGDGVNDAFEYANIQVAAPCGRVSSVSVAKDGHIHMSQTTVCESKPNPDAVINPESTAAPTYSSKANCINAIQAANMDEASQNMLPIDAKGDTLREPHETDALVGFCVRKRFRIDSMLGKGGYATVYEGTDLEKSAAVAIKVEPADSIGLVQERIIYRKLKSRGCTAGFPSMRVFCTAGAHNFLVMDRLGQSVYKKWKNKSMPVKEAAHLAWQMLWRLQAVHHVGVVHCDVKPENMLYGMNNPEVVHLVDFGVSRAFQNMATGQIYEQVDVDLFVGSSLFAPATAHDGKSQCRRDDLESLGYVLLSLMGMRLPWEGKGKTEEDVWEVVGRLKRETEPEVLCHGMPAQMVKYFKYTRNVTHEEGPDYDMLRSLMEEMGGK